MIYNNKKIQPTFFIRIQFKLLKILVQTRQRELYKMHLKWAVMLEDGLLRLRRFRSGP